MLLTTFRLKTYRMPASVDSKPLTEKLSPLDATLTKNQGVGPVIVNQESDKDSCPEEHRDEGSLPRVTSRKSRITSMKFARLPFQLSTVNLLCAGVARVRATVHGSRVTRRTYFLGLSFGAN